MIKVITYGTYDLLHEGHIRLLERAKKLGDYLIVGVTSDDFDKTRGKINVQQSLSERIESVRLTGLADQIIVEEYEGQKIDDIIKYGVSIFTVGSDWVGKFDYLKAYCEVIYLPRTEGISSSELRTGVKPFNIGVIGNTHVVSKIISECSYINGLTVSAVCSNNVEISKQYPHLMCESYESLLGICDAVYILSHPDDHYTQIKQAILSKKHVIVESPIVLENAQLKELYELADESNVILMEAIKTAYSTAFNRMILLAKSGKIGDIVSVDSTCTSLKNNQLIANNNTKGVWCSMHAWAPTALLPIIQLFGTKYASKKIISFNLSPDFDLYSKFVLVYPKGVGSASVGKYVKSEGDLVISGTKGYIYVPSPWWITDYFELRYENQSDNKRYFYQLDGEGIRNELAYFIKLIKGIIRQPTIQREISTCIVTFLEDYKNKIDCESISPNSSCSLDT